MRQSSVSLAAVAVLAYPAVALGGMPSLRLTDIAEMRLQNISFFLLGFLLSAFFIQLLWNYLRKDWTFLPRLSYPRAIVVVTLWGLLFILVLTMISGARELMTPGAWEKDGLTYKLKASHEQALRERDQKRSEQLELLGQALMDYARAHDGNFPSERSDPAIPSHLWLLPETGGLRYLYSPGRRAEKKGRILAWEPDLFDGDLFALFTTGNVRRVTSNDLQDLLKKE